MNLVVSTTEENPTGFEERRALAIFKETTFFRGNRYEAGLLCRDNDLFFPHNRAMALRRFN